MIGVSHYYDPQIQPQHLPSIDYSIDELQKALLDKGGFESSNIKIFKDGVDKQNILFLPIKFSIIHYLLNLRELSGWQIQKNDFFLFYFIGHGYGSSKGDQLLTMDTCFEYLPETALSTKVLTRLIRLIPANHKLLIFDACRNEVEGVLGLGVVGEGLGKTTIKDFITIYACQPAERAYIPNRGNLPIFTEAFIRAVVEEECYSIKDMYNLVCDQVEKKSYEIKRLQTPELSSNVEDQGAISFLSRPIPKKQIRPIEDKTLEEVRSINKDLHNLYNEIYPIRAPSYRPFMNAAAGLKELASGMELKYLRKISFEFFERGKNADIYTISYMLRWNADILLFEPLVECLLSQKYRGTVVWQSLAALEVMLRDRRMVTRLANDDTLSTELIELLKKMANEHPTREGAPFLTSVVWGKILQICKRLKYPEKEIFPRDALATLERA